jgi:hypothetical protein
MYNKEMVLCTFCNKEYKTKSTLKVHQSGRACLKNKPMFIDPVVYQCKLCEKDFTNKRNLQFHEIRCQLKRVSTSPFETLESVKTENNLLKNKVELLSEEINKYHQQIEDLKRENYRQQIEDLKRENYCQQIEDLKSVIFKLSDKTNITNIDNRKIIIKVKNYIKESPECMSIENLQKYIPKLNISHILSEGDGYGRFVVQYIKDNIRMITTDASRRVVFYKGENGKVVKDIGLINFFTMFCKAYSVRVEDLIKSLKDNLNLDLSEPDNLEQYRGYTKHITQIKQGSEGCNVDFIPSALKIITSGTDQNNLIC